jgi:predicted ATPase
MFLSITPRNLLSFGPETAPIEMKPLNLLIGPNASALRGVMLKNIL